MHADAQNPLGLFAVNIVCNKNSDKSNRWSFSLSVQHHWHPSQVWETGTPSTALFTSVITVCSGKIFPSPQLHNYAKNASCPLWGWFIVPLARPDIILCAKFDNSSFSHFGEMDGASKHKSDHIALHTEFDYQATSVGWQQIAIDTEKCRILPHIWTLLQ